MGMFDKLKSKIQPPTVPVSSMNAPPRAPLAPMGPAPPQAPPAPQPMAWAPQGPPPMAPQMPMVNRLSPQGPPPIPPQAPQPQFAYDGEEEDEYPEEYYYEEEPRPPVVSAPEPRRISRGGYKRQPDVKVINERGVFTTTPEESPVFIKLSRYEEVLSEVTNLRQIISNLNGILSIYETVREIESKMMSEWEMNVKRLEASEAELNNILMKMEPVRKILKDSNYDAVSPQKSDSIRDLEGRIRRLKDEISGMT